MSNLVHNETCKLRATYFNNLAVAVAAAGMIVPYVGGPLIVSSWPVAAPFIGGLFVSACLHAAALFMLSRMRD